MTLLVATHLAGGSLALLGSYAAFLSPKGGALHRKGGLLFVYAMILMGTTAVLVGLERDKVGTGIGGLFVIYYVITAVTTLRPRTPVTARLDLALTLLAAGLSMLFFLDGMDVLLNMGGVRNGVPAQMILFLAAVAALAVFGDVRVMRRGPLTGRLRLVRHLWRMCFAAFFASGSFFLGQMKVIPGPLRVLPVLLFLALLPLGMLVYWRWRLRARAKLPARIVLGAAA